MRKFSRGITIGLVITLCLWGWGLVGYAQDSPLPNKSISPDEVNPKLETVLQELSRTAQLQPQALRQMAKDRGIPLQADMVTVIVEPASGRVSSISRAGIAVIGGKVEASSQQLMRVQIPVDRLESLANKVSGIAFIRLPYRPRALAVTSEGVGLTGADDFHTAGYYGQGVKVAVVDLGFIGLAAAQAAGELENVVYTHDYTGSGLETYTKHGTAVAEIVADMAPQADLYLMKIGDSVDLQNALNDCITNGIKVINHSVGWYNTNFYDGTGTVAGIANSARDNGILWVNAAGNEASDGHWQGAFVDSDGDKYLDFGSGTDNIDGDSIDEGNRIYLKSGDTVNIYMTWDDWSSSDQDYDLYLYNSFGTMVASSTSYQSGTQQPTEAISYTAASAGYYEIAIYDYSATTHPQIEFFAFTDSGADLSLEYHNSESTIVTPANSAKVLAVGAIRQTEWTTGPQEYFSSQGPSNASKYATSITKPDICGPDDVSNYTYGSFYGTSAASPHVAGAAALLLSENPTLTADQLQAKLENDAIDMGASGKDNIYGSGRLSLLHLSGNLQLEVSTVSLNDGWQTVNLSKVFTNPVVVAKPLSYTGHDPAVVRIRNVTPSSFEIRVQEWDYKDGWHTQETVGYLVMERGHWTLPDGTEVEAGSTTTDATGSLIDVSFSSGFSISPVVITAVTTFNGSDTVATRNRNITTSGFETGMQEQEANAQSHTTETISYIAWEPGSGTADGKTYEVGRTGDTVTDAFHTINFGFGRSVSIKVDEEASKDSETSHTTENVGYIAFDTSPLILIADMQTRDGGDTANLRYQESESSTVQLEASTVSLNDGWQTVNLSKVFTNPVVVAKPLSYTGHDPAVVRIRNVTPSSFEIRVQEWDYKDGWHTQETVGYLVMERGHWTLPDGTEVEAGSTTTDATGSLIDVSFSSGFSISPVVITAVTTFNGSDTVATRNRNITTSGFETGMQEQEANAQSHTTETISYIAWEPGSGTADGKTYEVGRTGDTVTDAFHTINFGFGRSVSIKVDEEASKDSETSHTTENVGYIAFDTSPLILIADMQTRDGGDTANLRYQESESSSVQSMAYWQGAPFVEQVLSMPNPVRRGETARFVVKGQGIESVQVAVYDLSGRRVFTSDWYPGDIVEWHTVDDKGRRLANGAYLYLVKAKGANGEEVVSRVGTIFLSY
jgi:subtilisin family serine protease